MTAVLTPAGEFLRATATNAPAPEVPAEEGRSVFAAAFRLAVGLRFRTDAPLAAIAATVRNAARRHPELVLPVREAEMLIREALAEEVPIADIDPADMIKIHILIFAALVEELALTDLELDELIGQASS